MSSSRSGVALAAAPSEPWGVPLFDALGVRDEVFFGIFMYVLLGSRLLGVPALATPACTGHTTRRWGQSRCFNSAGGRPPRPFLFPILFVTSLPRPLLPRPPASRPATP